MFEQIKTTGCACGREHRCSVKKIITGSGAIKNLPECLDILKAERAFVVTDKNTLKAAGNAVLSVLDEAGRKYTSFTFVPDVIKPDEHAVGSLLMNFDEKCDAVIGVGSGVINDCCKILAAKTKKPYITVASAPSMDGFASDTSSMEKDGLKVSLPSKCPDIIIGDTDILKNAPARMLASGVGDMLAKYISIAEWRISALINGEYYCEEIAQLIRSSLKKCTDNASGLVRRESTAVNAVFEGLVGVGFAMSFAGVTRPASGGEHYFSHLWDMRGLEFGLPTELHGIQCALGTYISACFYHKLKDITPDREKAIAATEKFNLNAHFEELIRFVGKGAYSMIENEKTQKKFDLALHHERIDRIIEHYGEILKIIDEEIPTVRELNELYGILGLPTRAGQTVIDPAIIDKTFEFTKDVRDKYVLSRLLWDMGETDSERFKTASLYQPE